MLGLASADVANLTVSGGTVSSSGGSIGFAANTLGTATITTGATWNSPSDDISVATNGTGTLLLRNGGNVICKGAAIGGASTATGFVGASGIGSTFTNTGSMLIGSSGIGTFQLTAGATASVTGSASI